VFDLLRVDEARRLAYFTAGSQNAGENPYFRYLYSVSLDGGKPKLLTPEVADHEFRNGFGLSRPRNPTGSSISPSGRYIVDTYSTTEHPPRTVVRKIAGELVGEVLASDASALFASGWRPPERAVAKASDGVTDLHGVVFRPRDFDPSKKYPVIDYMYPGPTGRYAPLSFPETITGLLGNSQVFADAGFIVVAMDGRGTGYRSRAFRDAFLGTEDVFGSADHVVAIKNLAARYPQMDLERVGVMGQSFGGYGSLRAMLLHPDFFKVGVSATGPGDWFHFQSGISAERFFGVPAESAEARKYYDTVSNTRLALHLRGRVLLIYGGIDENVPLKQAFVLLDAFVKADKDVDTIIMPNSAHWAPGQPYVVRRSLQYFEEYLVRRPTLGR
jgi:dipeptidyl aminopeptidase/acylaminoacyl peptidase